MKRIVLGVVLSVVALLALIYLAGGPRRPLGGGAAEHGPAVPEASSGAATPDAGNGAREASQTTVAPPTAATGTPSASAATSLPPLPPAGTPVAAILQTLKERAAQGDTSAMCRLGLELQRCADASRTRSASSSVEGDLARRPDTPAGAPEVLARMQQQADVMGAGCDGVPEEDFALAFDLQMRAAEARPDLRVWAALNPALDPWNFVNDLERWQRYRAQAMPWLEQAAAEGDVSAIIALQRVHGDLRRNGPPFPRFRIADPERFVLYTDLLKRYGVDFPVVRPEYTVRRATLDPESLARIDKRVQELHRTDRAPLGAAEGQLALSGSMRRMPEPEDCALR